MKGPRLALVAALLVLGSGGSASAVTTAQRKEALGLITEEANAICNSIPTKQSSEKIELSEDAKIGLSGVTKKIADLGINEAAKYSRSSSQGLLQQQIAPALQYAQNCRLDVFHTLEKDFLHQGSSSPPAPHHRGHATAERWGPPLAGFEPRTYIVAFPDGGYTVTPEAAVLINNVGEYAVHGRASRIDITGYGRSNVINTQEQVVAASNRASAVRSVLLAHHKTIPSSVVQVYTSLQTFSRDDLSRRAVVSVAF